MGKSTDIPNTVSIQLLGGAVNYSGAGTVTGDPFDARNAVGRVVLMLTVGNRGGSSPTLDVTIEQSADGSTGWTAVPGGAFAQITGTEGFEKLPLDVDQLQPFFRFVSVVGGSGGVTWTAFIHSVAGTNLLPPPV